MIVRFIVTLIAAFVIVLPAHAQQASYAMFDFEQTERGVELVVAVQPERAVEVIGGTDTYEDMLEEIRGGTEMLAAYIESHVEISQGGTSCAWSASPDPVEETLLDAQAEGITVRGTVACPDAWKPFTLHTDLFTEYPGHWNEVRYRDGDTFVPFATLNRENQQTDADLREVFAETLRETDGAVRSAGRVNALVAAVVILCVFGVTFWLRRKMSGRKRE